MVIKTLMYNIKQDLTNLFTEAIEYEGEEIDDFTNVLVKEVYEENPKITYPMITIQEYENSEADQYSSNKGEEYSNLAYQINVLSKNTPHMQAIDAVRLMIEYINTVLGDQYKMVRETPTPPQPLPSDNNVLVSSMRYTCVFDISENRIYKS